MLGIRNLPTTKWHRKKSSIQESDFFSLHLRILAIKKLRPYDDLHSADAPIVWERISTGYRIVDLQLDRFMQALHFILTHFCQTEPICKAVGLHDDAVSMKVFMNKVFAKMEGMMSFCAIQEGTNKLVGVLIASIFEKSQWFIRKEQGETLRRVMMLKNYATAKAHFYETLNSKKSICVDFLCVKNKHQKNGIGTALLRSCVTRASEFATACVGQFTSGAAQTIATRLQFEILYELPYQYQQKSRFHVFEACYPENYSIACMAVRLSPPQLQLPMPKKPVVTVPTTEKPTKTRKKGRKKK